MPSTPEQSMLSGLKPADHEFLDFATVQPLKEARRVSENLVTAEQMKAIQAATPPDAPTPPPPPLPAAPTTTPAAPLTVPGATTPPAPASPAPPTSPNDSQRVSDRINKLWGEKRSAEERAVEAERKLAELLALQNTRPQFSQVGTSNPPLDSFASGPGSDVPAGYISRDEFQRELARQTQELLRYQALTQAHTVSRSEALRDFPDVFANPSLEAAANRIWETDKALKEDPHGPYKAAALARGLGTSFGGAAQHAGGVPSSLRKEELSGVGASVAEGSGTAPDRAARYQEAIAKARRSGREEDAVRARLIQQGIL